MSTWYKPPGWPSWRELLEIAESANPPLDGDMNETLDAKDGWKVVFFYDCDG